MMSLPHLLFLFLSPAFSSSLHMKSLSIIPRKVSPPRAACFLPSHRASAIHIHNQCWTVSSSATYLCSTDDKQAEILALEERLRLLRDEDGSTLNVSLKNIEVPLDINFDERDDMFAETAESIMFSERWKLAKAKNEIKQDEKRKEGILNIGLALGLLVFVGIFSQVPIGEESLQKYQAIQGNPARIDLGDLNSVLSQDN